MSRRIPIFFASDDIYLPYLAVTVKSISDHGTEGNIYDIKVLTNGLSRENQDKLMNMELQRTSIEVIDINEVFDNHRNHLRARLRDYYSESIFYRVFIASLYPELDKAIYIDCDIVLVDDIAKLYDTDIGSCVLGAVADECIPDTPEFCDYVDKWVGTPADKYINSGVLLMNLEQFRSMRIEKKITEYASRYNFDTVAPDQDYLNFLCRDRIYYLDYTWNKQPNPERPTPVSELHLIHFNMFKKPWHYSDVLYFEEFWRVADTTPFKDYLHFEFDSYTDEQRHKDINGAKMLLENAARLSKEKNGFASVLGALTV